MIVRIPQTFRELSVPLPPMLLELVGVGEEHRFAFLYYWSGKPTWSDGESCTGFPLYSVWQPYIEDEAMQKQLTAYNLGADNEEPSHALVCDRVYEKVYVAPFGSAIAFLNNQQPKTQLVAVRHWQAMKAQAFAYTRVTFDHMQSAGMFEAFLPPTPEQKQKTLELVAWLDKYI